MLYCPRLEVYCVNQAEYRFVSVGFSPLNPPQVGDFKPKQCQILKVPQNRGFRGQRICSVNKLIWYEFRKLVAESQKLVGELLELVRESQKLVGELSRLVGESRKLVGELSRLVREFRKLVRELSRLVREPRKLVGELSRLVGESWKLH